MKSANLIGMVTYLIAWGFVVSLFTDNYDLMKELGGLTIGGYLLFIITENYEH